MQEIICCARTHRVLSVGVAKDVLEELLSTSTYEITYEIHTLFRVLQCEVHTTL
jgi:hypothetical protein